MWKDRINVATELNRYRYPSAGVYFKVALKLLAKMSHNFKAFVFLFSQKGKNFIYIVFVYTEHA